MSVSPDELHQPPATCVAARARSDSWVRIMFATLVDAGVKVVGTSGNGHWAAVNDVEEVGENGSATNGTAGIEDGGRC